jgi:hypothetical protein
MYCKLSGDSHTLGRMRISSCQRRMHNQVGCGSTARRKLVWYSSHALVFIAVVFLFQYCGDPYHGVPVWSGNIQIAGIVPETNNQAFSPSPFPQGGYEPHHFTILLLPRSYRFLSFPNPSLIPNVFRECPWALQPNQPNMDGHVH